MNTVHMWRSLTIAVLAAVALLVTGALLAAATPMGRDSLRAMGGPAPTLVEHLQTGHHGNLVGHLFDANCLGRS